jgi:pyrimidine operon attenuation protein/uracil phosphoribosyltransferase
MSTDSQKIIAEIMDARGLDRTLARLAHEIIERNRGAENLVIVGLRTRGAPIAKRLRAKIKEIEGIEVPFGILDITFYRDDVTKRSEALLAQTTKIPFDIDGKVVLVVDDVLYTGRTIRAAMDALVDFGRPARIELAVMVDRGHRELPIKADYVGKSLLTSLGEEVAVRLKSIDGVDRVDLVVSS